VLLGQVVDTQGAGKSNVAVAIFLENRELVATKSSQDGYFAFKGLRGGVYRVSAEEGQGLFRVWSAGTAPPNAQQGALVVSDNTVARGQFTPGQGIGKFLTRPVVVAGVVATAVAVPVAVHNSQSSEPASP